jgi:hypothetical protein
MIKLHFGVREWTSTHHIVASDAEN